MFGFSLFGPPQSGTATAGAVVSVGKDVVGSDELGTASGAFELLAGGVLQAANFGIAFGTLLVGTVRHFQTVTQHIDDIDDPVLSSI